jgi:hypothetical protein
LVRTSTSTTFTWPCGSVRRVTPVGCEGRVRQLDDELRNLYHGAERRGRWVKAECGAASHRPRSATSKPSWESHWDGGNHSGHRRATPPTQKRQALAGSGGRDAGALAVGVGLQWIASACSRACRSFPAARPSCSRARALRRPEIVVRRTRYLGVVVDEPHDLRRAYFQPRQRELVHVRIRCRG